jgi:carbon storage regulator
MLVITRKLDEGLVIDGDIEVVVLGIEDGKVKIGIEAPRDKKIYRKEIFESIKQENQNAINIDKDILSNLPKK